MLASSRKLLLITILTPVLASGGKHLQDPVRIFRQVPYQSVAPTTTLVDPYNGLSTNVSSTDNSSSFQSSSTSSRLLPQTLQPWMSDQGDWLNKLRQPHFYLNNQCLILE